MAERDTGEGITERDVNDALRLAREFLYSGGEPYAPAVMSIARMLVAYRTEVLVEDRLHSDEKRLAWEVARLRMQVHELEEALRKTREGSA